jgi:hypothetical protein
VHRTSPAYAPFRITQPSGMARSTTYCSTLEKPSALAFFFSAVQP